MSIKGISDKLKSMSGPSVYKLVLLFAIGVTFLLASNYFSDLEKDASKQKGSSSANLARQSATQAQNASNTGSGGINYEHQLEQRLKNTLSLILGVGKLEVLLTLEYGHEIVVGTDVSTQQSGQLQSHDSKTVVIRNDGTDTPLILKEINPKVEGVVIVAEGGDDVFVKDALTKAAQALLDVPAHKVHVFKMQ